MAPLNPARYFDSDPAHRQMAQQLYDPIAGLPLVCPHGHVPPQLFADDDYRFGSPVDLLLIPDHYIFRMLYSQGVPLTSLGIPTRDDTPIEGDHRKIWQTLTDHWYLFRGTPTGIWVRDELAQVFGVEEPLNGDNAQAVYDAIDAKLNTPDFTPRNLYTQFNIEVMATTDAATDTLADHRAIRESGWDGRIIPTFRPDAVVNLDTDGWQDNINALSEVSGVTVSDYRTFVQALEQRRTVFKQMGATATDHGASSPYTEPLSDAEADEIFQRALAGKVLAADGSRFTGHMLIEMARMSTEDGLVMQLHVGSRRNHNAHLFRQHGRDMGGDIPERTEFTRNLKPLLDAHGNHPDLTLILFTLDESAYSRELAPMAGHYPILRLGPPWWFFDSLNGVRRYFDSVVETAGIYNTAGFNDDTRAFLSIPVRHDVRRRAVANWLAGQVLRHIIS
ncbi:MAG: glucuronate isomerase, partial [Chloroflexota bacterium]